MKSSADLWKEYCSFYEKPFSIQLEANEALLKEHLQRWGQTAQAKILCPRGCTSIDDVPVTAYSDYQFLAQFKSRMEKSERDVRQMPGEVSWDYYDRIGRAAAEPYQDYVIGEFSFVTKTTGTVGEPKWMIHGSTFWENYRKDVLTATLFSCSDSWGRTRFRLGDKGLNFTPSAPYLSGWGRKASQGIVVDVPPVDVMDSIPDVRRRFFAALEYLEKGHEVNLAGGVAPSVYLMCEYFTSPEHLFKEYYDSMDMGPAKLVILQKWAKAKVAGTSRRARDFLNLKGLMIGGVDTSLYYDYLRAELGVEPFCIYGVSELGLPMFGTPDQKQDLLPNLRSCYFDFRNEQGELKKMEELNVGNTYDLIITSFGGMFARYDVQDTVRVSGKRDDGMPVFSFWGRKNAALYLGGLPLHITEAVMTQVMHRAGLTLSDKWAVTKTLRGREKLLILMENSWGISETEVAKKMIDAMVATNPDLAKYASEFGAGKPEDLVEVEFLKKGAFLRYSMKKAREGYPMGQVKPPKIVVSERQDICDALRSA